MLVLGIPIGKGYLLNPYPEVLVPLLLLLVRSQFLLMAAMFVLIARPNSAVAHTLMTIDTFGILLKLNLR